MAGGCRGNSSPRGGPNGAAEASDFGSALRAVRIDAALSLNAAAVMAGVSAPYLSDVELGRRPPLARERLQRLAPVLGLAACERLAKISVCVRGAAILPVGDVSPLQRAVGVRLALAWSNLSSETVVALADALEVSVNDP